MVHVPHWRKIKLGSLAVIHVHVHQLGGYKYNEVVTISVSFDFSEFLGDDGDAPRGAETRMSLRLRLIVVFDFDTWICIDMYCGR